MLNVQQHSVPCSAILVLICRQENKISNKEQGAQNKEGMLKSILLQNSAFLVPCSLFNPRRPGSWLTNRKEDPAPAILLLYSEYGGKWLYSPYTLREIDHSVRKWVIYSSLFLIL